MATNAFSQRRVSGVVFHENNEPAIGTSIIEAQTNNRVAADFYGKFEIVTTTDTAELHFSFIGYETQSLKITSDSIVTIRLEIDVELHDVIVFTGLPFVRRTVGMDYDIANTMLGVSFNTFRRLRSHRFNFAYTISAQTNFKQDYGFGSSIEFRHPIRQIRRLSTLSLNYRHKNYSENIDLNFNKVSIRGRYFVFQWWWLGRLELFAEPAFQSLNGNDNFGLIMGLGSWIWLRGRGSPIDLSVGYFNDYWTYSISALYFLNRRLALQMSYERIDRFNFFNAGVRYTISERWR